MVFGATILVVLRLDRSEFESTEAWAAATHAADMADTEFWDSFWAQRDACNAVTDERKRMARERGRDCRWVKWLITELELDEDRETRLCNLREYTTGLQTALRWPGAKRTVFETSMPLVYVLELEKQSSYFSQPRSAAA